MSGAELMGLVLIGTTWGVALLMALVSTGVAFAYAAMPPLIMASVPTSETAAANALNSLCRSLGTSVASAAVGAVLGQLTVSIGGAALPTEAAIRIVLAAGAGAAAVACLFALAIPSRRRIAAAASVPLPRPAAAPEPAQA